VVPPRGFEPLISALKGLSRLDRMSPSLEEKSSAGARRCTLRVVLTVVKTVVRRVPANGRSAAKLSSTDGESAPCSRVATARLHEEAMSQATPRLRRIDPDSSQDKSSTGRPWGSSPKPAFVRHPKMLVILVVLTGRTRLPAMPRSRSECRPVPTDTLELLLGYISGLRCGVGMTRPCDQALSNYLGPA